MNNILAAQVLRSHLPEITDGAYKTAMEIAIETLYKDAYEDWKKWYSDELSAMEYLELTEEEYYYWLLGGEKVGEFKVKEKSDENDILNIPSREKELREKITEECSRKDDVNSQWSHNYHISQNNNRYDFRGCPDDLECAEGYMFSALCDEVSNFDCKKYCKKCWENFLRGEKC